MSTFWSSGSFLSEGSDDEEEEEGDRYLVPRWSVASVTAVWTSSKVSNAELNQLIIWTSIVYTHKDILDNINGIEDKAAMSTFLKNCFLRTGGGPPGVLFYKIFIFYFIIIF